MSINNTEYIVVKPLYIGVRKEALLYLGVGNPDDPYDYEAISTKVGAVVNDVEPPYANMIYDEEDIDVTVYPCDENTPVVANTKLIKSTCTLAGVFTVLIYRFENPQVFAEAQEFIGLNQVVSYNSLGSNLPTSDEFTISLRLINGGDNNPSYIGYTGLVFQPDNPQNPNGAGTYFFVIWPEARIAPKSLMSEPFILFNKN